MGTPLQLACRTGSTQCVSTLLEAGVATYAPTGDDNWMRNGAGVVFRLYGLLAVGSLAVAPRLGDLLTRAYEGILSPLDRADCPDVNGVWHGCLYCQALSAWLSAHRCGSEDSMLRETVRRLGTAIAKICQAQPHKRMEVKSHVVEPYVVASHEPVWGGREHDLFWQAVFK